MTYFNRVFETRLCFDAAHLLISPSKVGCVPRTAATVSNSNEGGLSVAVPIKGVPVQFGGNLKGSDAAAWFGKYCSSNSGTISDEQAAFVAASLVPPDAVAAWRDCVTAKLKAVNSQRLTMAFSLSEPSVTLTINWNPDALRTDAPRATSNLLVFGATCSNPILKDQRLTGSQVIQVIVSASPP